MKPDFKMPTVIAAFLVFIGFPILLYVVGDFPRRSVMKEAFSVLMLLSFSLMLGLLYFARNSNGVTRLFDPRKVQHTHRLIGYCVFAAIFMHPFLIVAPRYFEAGIDPMTALVTLLTRFDNLGVVLGLVGWVLATVLAVTSIYRTRLINHDKTRHKKWRKFHGVLSLILVGVGLSHAFLLGRHINSLMISLMVGLAVIGALPLLKLYFAPNQKNLGAKS